MTIIPDKVREGTLILGDKLHLGNDVWIGMFVFLDCLNEHITIGSKSVLADFVKIYTHDTSYRTAVGFLKKEAPVEIGHCTQLGAGAIVLAGVKIGDHVIIGAGAVVTRDIPGWSVAVGVPAKVIKTLPPLWCELCHSKTQ